MPDFFSFRKGNAEFYQIPFTIDLQRDNRRSHFLDFCFESEDFIFFEENLSFTLGLIYTISSFILRDMYPSSIGMSFIDKYIGSFEIDTSISHTLDLLSVELQPCLILFDDFIIKERFFIFGKDDFWARTLTHAEIIDKSSKKQLVFL